MLKRFEKKLLCLAFTVSTTEGRLPFIIIPIHILPQIHMITQFLFSKTNKTYIINETA